jgi:hypothetical protein
MKICHPISLRVMYGHYVEFPSHCWLSRPAKLLKIGSYPNSHYAGLSPIHTLAENPSHTKNQTSTRSFIMSSNTIFKLYDHEAGTHNTHYINRINKLYEF